MNSYQMCQHIQTYFFSKCSFWFSFGRRISCCCSANRVWNFPSGSQPCVRRPSPWPSSSHSPVTAVSLSFPERVPGHLLHHEEVKERQTSRPQPGHRRGRRSCIRDAAIDPPVGQRVLDLKHLMRPGWDCGLEASLWADFFILWGNKHWTTGGMSSAASVTWTKLF